MPIDPPDIAQHPFIKAVGRALRRRCGVAPDQRLLVAVSGGADSVALWRALCILAPRRSWRLQLQLAHINHRQRPGADDEAAFVASLTAHQPAGTGEPACLTATLDPAEARGNLEASLRHQRYDALTRMAADRDADHLVTAHHADDQLETVLMRLLRGAAAGGLAGMAWRRRLESGSDRRLIRPMLAVTHDDAMRFLRDIGQAWHEDPTNRDATRWRARLRLDVLPALKSLRRDAPHKAVALGEHLRDVRRMLNAEARRCEHWIVRTNGTWTLPRDHARSLRRAVLTTLCRRLLIEAGAPRDALRRRVLHPMVRAIRDTRGGERTFDLPGGVTGRVTRDTVTFTPR